MGTFGWILFGLGALLLFVFGVVGMDSGYGNVSNLAGLGVGEACMISGAIFIAADYIRSGITTNGTKQQTNADTDSFSEPQIQKAEQKKDTQSSDWRFTIISTIIFIGVFLVFVAILGVI